MRSERVWRVLALHVFCSKIRLTSQCDSFTIHNRPFTIDYSHDKYTRTHSRIGLEHLF